MSARPEKVTRFLARATTPALCDALEKLHSKGELDAEETIARKWMLDELEERHPEVDAALEALCDALDAVNIDQYVTTALAAARELT